MEKVIKIIITEKETVLETSPNIYAYELMGVLRYFEKDIWLKVQSTKPKQVITDKNIN